MKKYVILFLWSISNQWCCAQTAVELKTMAINQYEHKNYQLCSEFYNRIAFFNADILDYQDYKNWAEACQYTKQIDNATELFQRVANAAPNDSTKVSTLLQIAELQLENKAVDDALATLLGLDDDLNFKNLQFRKLKNLSIAYLAKNEWITARQSMLQLLPADSIFIQSKFNEIEQLKKRYKPGKAKRLNYYMPGLGFFYGGSFWKGMNSFTLNAGLLTTMIIYASNVGFIDAMLPMFSPMQRYYKGGSDKAKEYTAETLEIKQNKVIHQLILLMYAKEYTSQSG